MLELIEQSPAISCVSHNDYKDKHKKTKAIGEAARILGVSSDAFTKKLHNLRSSYRRVVQQKKGKKWRWNVCDQVALLQRNVIHV